MYLLIPDVGHNNMNQVHSIGFIQTNKEDRKELLKNGSKKNSIQVKVKQHMSKRSRG